MGATVQGTAGDLAARSVVRFHQRIEDRGQGIPLRLWDGTELGPEDAGYRLLLRRPWALRSMLFPPSSESVGRAYLHDDVDVEGSMVAALRSLTALVDTLEVADRAALASLLRRLPRPPRRRPDDARARVRGRRHSKARDAAAIRHHYEQDVDFFACFLDPELVYSCGYFAEGDRDAAVTDPAVLARAQRRKLELVCRKLDLRPGERLLDVGCGWGALVVHAARHHGVHATGITLSPRQAAVARRRVSEEGLDDRVRIEVVDYRDVDATYDAISSIGMVEHVGVDQLETYAATLYGALAPGGRLLNHGITTGRRDQARDFARDRANFVARYVFPDGGLVPAHRTITVLERAGFELWDVEQLRPHYARTLAHWVAGIEREAATARSIAGDRAYRVWRAYMAGSVLGFSSGDLGVVQVLATRGVTDLPFGRDRMALPADV